jgi:hypothetical protein
MPGHHSSNGSGFSIRASGQTSLPLREQAGAASRSSSASRPPPHLTPPACSWLARLLWKRPLTSSAWPPWYAPPYRDSTNLHWFSQGAAVPQ